LILARWLLGNKQKHHHRAGALASEVCSLLPLQLGGANLVVLRGLKVGTKCARGERKRQRFVEK